MIESIEAGHWFVHEELPALRNSSDHQTGKMVNIIEEHWESFKEEEREIIETAYLQSDRVVDLQCRYSGDFECFIGTVLTLSGQLQSGITIQKGT